MTITYTTRPPPPAAHPASITDTLSQYISTGRYTEAFTLALENDPSLVTFVLRNVDRSAVFDNGKPQSLPLKTLLDLADFLS